MKNLTHMKNVASSTLLHIDVILRSRHVKYRPGAKSCPLPNFVNKVLL